MRLILKYILRNIMIKPLRTAVIILCLTAVSLTFSLCITINIASEKAMEELIRSGTGKTDIMLSAEKGFDVIPDLSEDVEFMPVVQAESSLQLHSIDNYKYIQKKNITVLGVDTDKAVNFNVIPQCAQPQNDEIIISYAISQIFGYDSGDVITLPCTGGSELTLTIKEVVLNKNFLSIVPLTVIVTPETARKISGYSDISANIIYVDVKDDNRITEISAELMRNSSDITVQQVMGTAEINDMVSGLTYSFFTLFAVTFMMIIFIISAFSKNIAAERMSSIGTFRSIGAEKKTATATLLIECAVYGIMGGLLGGLLFYALKDTLIGGIIPTAEGFGNRSIYAPLYIPLTGLVLSAVISCVFSLNVVVMTSKASIRDVIFGGKDTVFRPSATVTVTGTILFCVSLILYFLNTGFVFNISTLIAFITGLCLVIPKLMSFISGFAAKHTNGRKFPVLRLALIRSGTKKSAVSEAVICTAVVMLTSSLFILSRSVDMLYSVRNYNCDCIVTELSEKADRYRLITADKSEFIYNTEEVIEISGKNVNINIFGYDGFELFSGISGLPEKIGRNEIALDKAIMKRLGLSEGEKITLVLKKDTARPVKLEMTAISGCESIYYDMRCNGAVINLETYISVYHDYPSVLLAKTSDTDLVRRQIVDSYARFMTAEEYYVQSDSEAESITTLLYMLTFLGIVLAVISVSGNQTIGFEQSRHELAILRSQGMSMRQLSEMLILQAAIITVISSLCFAVFGNTVMNMISAILCSLDMNIPVITSPLGVAVLIAMMSAAVILTAVIPIRALKRMNTAEELKQE